jgi:serine/threonine-protein kinase
LNCTRALSIHRAIEICTQIADALEYLHARGYIHNDLKPANILIADRNGADWVYVLDFGIAKDRDHLGSATNEPFIATLLYAPPEQCNQTFQSKRSDVYQLGLILYECLTGQLPFDVSFDAVMDHRSKGDIVPAVYQAGSCILPNRIKSLMAKALAHNPEERPESMQALLDAMRGAISNDILG